MVFPKGPQGEQGVQGKKGEDGLSAFDLWKIVFQKDANTPIEEFFSSLRGKDGADGQSAYDLWKAAVDTGAMTNKDGSDYTDGNSWEVYLRWLQGGDVSVLHQYWLGQGNTGDLEAFIAAIFSCHCDDEVTLKFF